MLQLNAKATLLIIFIQICLLFNKPNVLTVLAQLNGPYSCRELSLILKFMLPSYHIS